jgi:hypothetical protein
MQQLYLVFLNIELRYLRLLIVWGLRLILIARSTKFFTGLILIPINTNSGEGMQPLLLLLLLMPKPSCQLFLLSIAWEIRASKRGPFGWFPLGTMGGLWVGAIRSIESENRLCDRAAHPYCYLWTRWG